MKMAYNSEEKTLYIYLEEGEEDIFNLLTELFVMMPNVVTDREERTIKIEELNEQDAKFVSGMIAAIAHFSSKIMKQEYGRIAEEKLEILRTAAGSIGALLLFVNESEAKELYKVLELLRRIARESL